MTNMAALVARELAFFLQSSRAEQCHIADSTMIRICLFASSGAAPLASIQSALDLSLDIVIGVSARASYPWAPVAQVCNPWMRAKEATGVRVRFA